MARWPGREIEASWTASTLLRTGPGARQIGTDSLENKCVVLHKISRGMERAACGMEAADDVQDGRGPRAYEARTCHVLASRQTMLLHHVDANESCAARKSTTDPFRVPDVCTSKAAESNVSFLWLATTALQVQEAFESIHQHGRPFARLLQPRWILVPRVFHAAPLRFRFTFLASSPEGSC